MAGLPLYLNRVTIKITQIQTGSSALYIDPDYAEPASAFSYGAEITLEAQVNFLSKDFSDLLRTFTGDQQNSRGHLVFRNPILDTSGNAITLQKGDKITEIADEAVEFYVSQIRGESPLNGNYLLKYCEFLESAPKRTSN